MGNLGHVRNQKSFAYRAKQVFKISSFGFVKIRSEFIAVRGKRSHYVLLSKLSDYSVVGQVKVAYKCNQRAESPMST